MFEQTNWTYPSEEAVWHYSSPDQRYMDNSDEVKLSIIQETFKAEHEQFVDFLTSKLNIPARTYYVMLENKLHYILFPELFEKDIEGITTDRAWVSNTRKLIKKYHRVAVKQSMPFSEKQKTSYALCSKVMIIGNRLSSTKATALVLPVDVWTLPH